MAEGSRYSLDQFLETTQQHDRGQGTFELESERILEVNLDGEVWTKLGSMVAYRGQIKFVREGILEHGIGKLLKRAVSGEGARLTKASGQGTLYLAEESKKITILELSGESLFVNGNDVLAFEPTLDWDVTLMRKVGAMLAGGLFNVRFTGSGLVAVTTHHDPLTLVVGPGEQIVTDPNATVLWSGNLQPEFKTDVSFKTFLGRGSGESIQMSFAGPSTGQGFVVVQPQEEVYFQTQSQGG